MTNFRFAALIAGLWLGISAIVGGAHAQAPGKPELSPAQQEARQKRAQEKQKLDECHKQAAERKILVRDLTKFLIDCVEK